MKLLFMSCTSGNSLIFETITTRIFTKESRNLDEICNTSTYIFEAIKNGSLNIVQLIMRCGSKWNTEYNTKKVNCVDFASSHDRIDILSYLYELNGVKDYLRQRNFNKTKTPLMCAASSNSKNAIQWLLNHGCPLDQSNINQENSMIVCFKKF